MKKMISLMALIIVGFMVAGTSVKHTIETTKTTYKTIGYQK